MDQMSKGSLRWVIFFRELRRRDIGRTRFGVKTFDFPINKMESEARTAINKNRKMSLETNPPTPIIIKVFMNKQDRKRNMFAKRFAGLLAFIELKI